MAVNVDLAVSPSKAVAVCFLYILSSTVARQAEKVYGAKGVSIQFTVQQLPEGTNVTSIVWKHSGDKAAEWFEGEEPRYFGMFKTTATLDMKTWALTISDLQPDFSGEYSAEVNHKDPTKITRLTVIDAVPVSGVKGQSITLKAEVPNIPVKMVEWTGNNKVVAVWEEGDSPTCHLKFSLDIKTFSLTIMNLQTNFSGLYAAEVNDIGIVKAYQITVEDNLGEPIITPHCGSASCTLNCTTVDSENTHLVTWTDNKGRKVLGSVWRMERSEHLDVIYTCNCSTSVSWRTKNITEQDMFSKYLLQEPSSTSHVVAGTLGSLAVLAVSGLLVGLAYLLRKRSKRNPGNRSVYECVAMNGNHGDGNINGPDTVHVDHGN